MTDSKYPLMVMLVGEQPAPNIFPLAHYKPEKVALVYTDFTEKWARLLKEYLGNQVEQPLLKLSHAYQVKIIQREISDYITNKNCSGDSLIFNLTGGTKTMMLGAYEVARRLKAQAFYYQTQGNISQIYPYNLSQKTPTWGKAVPVTSTLTLDQYLRLYVGKYKPNTLPRDPFESLVHTTLKNISSDYFEVMDSQYLTGIGKDVEVDLLVRLGNTIGVAEIKQKAGKKAIDQLNGVATRVALGTYTKKILISATPLHYNHQVLAKAHRIYPIILESGKNEQLSPGDKDLLISEVRKILSPKS